MDGAPILFTQSRVGRNNELFVIYKLRTMKNDTPDVATHLLEDPQSMYTRLGPFLRKYSLDELPQLLNIVKGDMLFVGPRPALYNQDDLVEQRTQVGVHTLVPGITGWAQINGRDEVTIPQKVKLDHYYLENRSLILDIKILIRTVFKSVSAADMKL